MATAANLARPILPRIEAAAEQIAVRFWGKVRHGTRDECWPWTGYRSPGGYGRFQLGGYPANAHRVAWALHNNCDPAPNLIVMHQCDNPPCCNPRHLRLGTALDNMRDKVSKGRHSYVTRRGEQASSSRLTQAQVASILRDIRVARLIAPEYGVHISTISAIRCGVSWGHFTGIQKRGADNGGI